MYTSLTAINCKTILSLHGRQLGTIQDDWKRHKPPEFKRSR